MSFADVNEQKRHPVAVLLVQLLDGARLAPKRRSGKAAEDEHLWFAQLVLRAGD